jgi:hypothetical protein
MSDNAYMMVFIFGVVGLFIIGVAAIITVLL